MTNNDIALGWKTYQSTIGVNFRRLLEKGILTDCTLVAEGKQLDAHKVILAACSPYLEAMLTNHGEKRPALIFKDFTFSQIKTMVNYMYNGAVNISKNQIGSFMKIAQFLKIEGLSDEVDNNSKSNPQMSLLPHTFPLRNSVAEYITATSHTNSSQTSGRTSFTTTHPHQGTSTDIILPKNRKGLRECQHVVMKATALPTFNLYNSIIKPNEGSPPGCKLTSNPKRRKRMQKSDNLGNGVLNPQAIDQPIVNSRKRAIEPIRHSGCERSPAPKKRKQSQKSKTPAMTNWINSVVEQTINLHNRVQVEQPQPSTSFTPLPKKKPRKPRKSKNLAVVEDVEPTVNQQNSLEEACQRTYQGRSLVPIHVSRTQLRESDGPFTDAVVEEPANHHDNVSDFTEDPRPESRPYSTENADKQNHPAPHHNYDDQRLVLSLTECHDGNDKEDQQMAMSKRELETTKVEFRLQPIVHNKQPDEGYELGCFQCINCENIYSDLLALCRHKKDECGKVPPFQ